jgi:hypothetical protein
MYKHKFLILFLIIVFAASTWGPALASDAPATAQTAKLVITNKTPKSVTINLTGPRNQSIVAPPGKTTVQLIPGKYEYSYSVCGADKKGKLNLAKSGKLNITACQMTNVKFYNVSDRTMVLTLNGPMTYNLTLPLGVTKVRVVKGTYRYSLSGCGGSPTNGTIVIKNGQPWVAYCKK